MSKDLVKHKRRKLRLPRAPMIRKVGGPMVLKTKRKPKYKKDCKDGTEDDM